MRNQRLMDLCEQLGEEGIVPPIDYDRRKMEEQRKALREAKARRDYLYGVITFFVLVLPTFFYVLWA